MYHLYRSQQAILLQKEAQYFLCPANDWDALINQENLLRVLASYAQEANALSAAEFEGYELLPPIGQQEVWGAGVTYFRSRVARMEEAKEAGGGDFYDRVYDAERPELFFKNTAHRVVGHLQEVRIRKDSQWNVPEPELTLLLNNRGQIIGYTAGNDMSSRDIEGANPLYLPQAKTYQGSAAIGPALWISPQPIPADTTIQLTIVRAGQAVFQGATDLNQMKRGLEELAEFLFRECDFPHGAYLMTGTGIIPADDFTLAHGDQIHIDIEHIGRLTNVVGA